MRVRFHKKSDGSWVDEVEDDENDGSFELVGDPVVPRHENSHSSASTLLHGSKQHPGPAL